ncbi:MAG TPA: hypothetical protein VM802_02195 [Chitinophaga sp.]|uniref:hypothetical protein n=1 Tax=Chitinophaga sp. TaxID=1869181 RepID=UPI002C3C8EDD|nr:hypothetical protein [Chitinophaga sp.]HVI43645.1 hypothetical protein [Chitinophaga sp.]
MKHLRFVLAPKTAIIVLTTILFPFLQSVAQENVFAYNASRFVNEKPVAEAAKKSFSIKLAQLDKDSLLFKLSVENPANEKITLYIKDNYNNVLLRETLPATATFEARYNLQSLEDGQYTFEIRNGKNKLAEKAIGIKTQTIVNRNVSL